MSGLVDIELQPMPFADIAIPSPMRTAFTYLVPEGMPIEVGMRAVVPFHRRTIVGVCLSVSDVAPEGIAANRFKPLQEVLDEKPIFSAKLMELMRWMAAYYGQPIGEIVRAALPARLLKQDGPRTTRPTTPLEVMSLPDEHFTLNEGQQQAFDDCVCATASEHPGAVLLHGITGSGKTEVYLRLFERLIEEKRQGLLLVPEIGLTSQLVGRTAARFGERIAVYHSGLTDAQRHEQWRRIRSGEVDLVIGTRSALFAPLDRLGAIVVDEEHDSSYKQDEGVNYHGRDVAVMRAHLEGALVVMGSATPSLESLANVRNGKYRLHHLPVRTGVATLPSIEIVDMRRDRRRRKEHPNTEGWRRIDELHSLSPELYDAVAQTFDRGEQSLIFIGRRGFASMIQCEDCGEVFHCPNCDIALTAHDMNGAGRLSCHYCDYTIPAPEACAACHSSNIVSLGRGTERVEAELADFFPEARIARLDSDMAASAKRRGRIIDDMRRGAIDILVGTQMVTKGHDFPAVTLVGVISADLALHLPDFRAAERTFQLVTQVAGRAGRADKPGRVIVQTHNPEHFSLLAARDHDVEGFASEELAHRMLLGYPPIVRLANVRFSATDSKFAGDAAERVTALLRKHSGAQADAQGITVLGPAPAPLSRVRGRYRFHALIKAPTAVVLTRFLAQVRPEIEAILPRRVRLSIDVDPTSLL